VRERGAKSSAEIEIEVQGGSRRHEASTCEDEMEPFAIAGTRRV
jgi:hypothetical protein